MAKIIIELEIDGDADDAAYVAGEILDEGILQDAINFHEFDASELHVESAVVRPGGA